MVAVKAPPVVEVELPVVFDERWNRVPGITVQGARVRVDPSRYFFRFDAPSWPLCGWARVERELLPVRETREEVMEEIAADYVAAHGRSTRDAGEVLRTAWGVYSFLLRDSLLPVAGLEEVGPVELGALRQAATFMALNSVAMDGAIRAVGPCWFAAEMAGVVFGLDGEVTGLLDEVLHGAWFGKRWRLESLKAHAALGGRLVHGSSEGMFGFGGACMPFGASLPRVRRDLALSRRAWLEAGFDAASHGNWLQAASGLRGALEPESGAQA
jgi:hypothetical protein